MLVNLLMEVLDACRNAGFDITVTVCNIGAIHVKALKLLGVNGKTPFCRFKD
jgi:hypothetical protein